MYFVSSLTEMSIFRVLNLVQLQLRSASESVQPVLIIWVGLDSNQVRFLKSLASEPGLSLQLVSQFFGNLTYVLYNTGVIDVFYAIFIVVLLYCFFYCCTTKSQTLQRLYQSLNLTCFHHSLLSHSLRNEIPWDRSKASCSVLTQSGRLPPISAALGGGGGAVGRYMIYVYPLISTTFFLFLADFPSLVFFLFLYKHVTLGSYHRTTIHQGLQQIIFSQVKRFFNEKC